MAKHCGYIALLGRPNAGKSTLLNALVGDKLAVVSRKPQTTRNRILGVALEGETQLVFLDTPGLHTSKGKALINATMNHVATTAASDADVLVYLVDAELGFTDGDGAFLSRVLSGSTAPFVVMLSKVDAMKKNIVERQRDVLEQRLTALFETEAATASQPTWAERRIPLDPPVLSAKRPEMVDGFKGFLAAQLPEGEWMFEEDDITDLPQSFLVAELIREQTFRQLGQEIPYGCAVKTSKIEEKPELTAVSATIIVSRKSHKGMVVGKGGARIKEIGTAARVSLERHFGRKVFLDLQVAVEEGWINDQRLIAELAHLADIGKAPDAPDSPSQGPEV